MLRSKVNRRKFLYSSAAGAAGLLISPFTAAANRADSSTTEPMDHTTFLPAVQKNPLPREQTLISDLLTGQVGDPTNFNDWVGWKWRDRGLQNLAFEPLWSVDFATGTIIAGAADGDPVYSPDFTQVTIHLRQGITWSDGQPFTSADVVYTVECLKNHPSFNNSWFFNEYVETVTAPDALTVHFTLKQANSRFHTTFLDRWGCTQIMPKHIFENAPDPVAFEFNPPVGLGPYKLHSFSSDGNDTIWVKRDDWANTPTGQLFGEPKPKYIIFRNYPSEDARIQAQAFHQADTVNLTIDGLKTLLAQSKSSRAYQATYPWVVNNDPAITGITYNTQRAPFNLADVRWALTLAIDYVRYVAAACDGVATMSPVHIPHLGPYPADYIVPMQDWLKQLTIDLGNGESFAVYDPTVQQRVVAYAKGRGYAFPEDQASLDRAFGIGWYKYAPDAAEKLLKKNGFARNTDGKWLKPDGTLWTINFLTDSGDNSLGSRNAIAAVAEWQAFGINAVLYPSSEVANLSAVGDFDVSSTWPAFEPWGAGPDLYRVLDPFKSAYVVPLGERTAGHQSRWSSPAMDTVIQNLFATDPTQRDPVVAAGMEGLKELVRQMPSTPTFGYVGAIAWDQAYWTNWPGAENAYTQPYAHWGPFKYMTPFLKPAGA